MVETWSALQAEICMNVANAKYFAFVAEAERMADWVRLGVVGRKAGADYLHEAAIYNQLYFEYGTDRIQKIIAESFQVAA